MMGPTGERMCSLLKIGVNKTAPCTDFLLVNMTVRFSYLKLQKLSSESIFLVNSEYSVE